MEEAAQLAQVVYLQTQMELSVFYHLQFVEMESYNQENNVMMEIHFLEMDAHHLVLLRLDITV